jgi:hypothetical protein
LSFYSIEFDHTAILQFNDRGCKQGGQM